MVTKKQIVIVAVVASVAALAAVAVAVGVVFGLKGAGTPSTLPPDAQDAFIGTKVVRAQFANQVRPNGWNVLFHDGVDVQAHMQTIKAAGWTVENVMSTSGVMTMNCPDNILDFALRQIGPNAAMCEQDTYVNATEIPGLDRIDQRNLPLDNQVFPSPAFANNGAGAHVYVLDTGIRSTHTEFNNAANRIRKDFTAIQDGKGTEDCNGHGTHVSGTIGGKTFGIARGATLHAIRVLDCAGSGSNTGVIQGIDFVAAAAANAANRPAVGSMSLGGPASLATDAAIQRAINAGVTMVVAAGNENQDACNVSPARAANAITVGAIDPRNDQKPAFSNFGTCVDIFGPGVNILSAGIASDTATATLSGTSMATPHVSGVVAVLLGQFPTLTPAQVTSLLIASSTPNKVIGAGTGSPNRNLFFPVAGPQQSPPPPPPPAPVPAPPPPPPSTRTFNENAALAGTNAVNFHPGGKVYQTTKGGSHIAKLTGPTGTDFDLDLFQFVNNAWIRVATSQGPTSTEAITFNAPGAGTFVWRVRSFFGAGSYNIAITVPI